MTPTTSTPTSRSLWASTRTRPPGSRSSATLCAETLAGIADPLFPALASARRAGPAQAARAILGGLLAPLELPLPAVEPPAWLLPHQAEAALRTWAILERFGGALLADGVGLGKTYVGLGLGEFERRRGGDMLVIAPASLRPEWQRAAAEVGVRLSFVSHTSLARRAPRVPDGVTLLVVDEAHGFRNPRTLRYGALARLSVARRVALLTATPVNNTASDLAALVHLFAGADDFRPFGVADIQAALRQGDGETAALALGAITVSRSRRVVEAQFPALRSAFPQRQLLPPVRYDLDGVYGGTLGHIVDRIADLDGDAAASERGAALMALGLLRRLESGRAAFLGTLRRHRDFLREWAVAREAGTALGRHAFRAAAKRAGDASQLVLWQLLLRPSGDAPVPAEHAWRATVERLLQLAEAAPDTDPKLRALEDLLAGPLDGRKVIVFTEYRDTALAIARHLRRHVRLLCVAGDGAWAGTERLSRREALDAFAPRARGASPRPLLAADVLVATDVASEGMNLQDAAAVVNFDLPWNPVRVMQRIGRIDRLHSPHRVVTVAHLVPRHGLHDLTGVLRTLRRKLAALPVAASPEPDPLHALWWLDAGSPLPEALERESWRRVEPFEARERWREAIRLAPVSADPCVAAGIAVDEQAPAAGLLLSLEWPDGARVPLPFVLTEGGGCRCDAAALGALAERALAAEPLCASPADFATTLAAALPEARHRLLEYSAARLGSAPRGPGRIAALRVVARAGRAAARGRDEGALHVLSEANAALAAELPAGVDRALQAACRHPDSPALPATVAAILTAADRRARPRVPPEAPRLVFVAAVALAGRCPADASRAASRGRLAGAV
jgi:superfamily II DNA or RNA helicase